MNKRVAVVYPSSISWVTRCMDGVRQYAREAGGWHILSSPPAFRGVGGSLSLKEMRGWKGDGIIALIDDRRELRTAAGIGIPVVNLGSGLPGSFGVPRVSVNHFKAGQMAADHLLARGLSHLSFFGWKDVWYSDQRSLGFAGRAAEAGVKCGTFLRNPNTEIAKYWTRRIAEPAEWLATLPRPCGVFAVHDYMAQLLMEACQEAQLRIPDDIALIGMDDDASICEHSVPTLTSVSRNSERVGREAAALLDRMMQGSSSLSADLLVDPDGVVARQSTDKLYCSDAVVQSALDYMRAHLASQFNIECIAEHAMVSKRTLEMRFRECLQSSPHDFLTKLRVQHAQALMQLPQRRTFEQIASESGFGTAPAFYAAFQRITGKTPWRYRKDIQKIAGFPPRDGIFPALIKKSSDVA